MRRRHLVLLFSIFFMGLPLVAAIYSGVVQPTGITLEPAQQQQFTLSGYGDNILWSVLPPSMGTISSTGLYTTSSQAGVAYIYAQPVGSTSSYMSLVYQSVAGVSTSPTIGSSSGPGVGSSPTPITPAPSPTPPPPPVTSAPNPSFGSSPNGPTVGPSPFQPSNPVPQGPTVGGLSIAITPATTYLQAGQSISFTALIQGFSTQQVQWSISPAIGSIVNGFYTAPSSITNDTQVTIWATSLVDSSRTATATVLLSQPLSTSPPTLPNVSISIAQGATTLTAGQSALFTASVQGVTNTGVLWSMTPNVGTLINGVYTAPANITSQETITLTASSAADPTKTASVAVILQPSAPPVTVSISLSPSSASLTGGQSTTFRPAVSGTSNTGVIWSLSPQVGTITNGVYQAPAVISSQQTITITATSAADPTKSASVSVILQPSAPPVTVSISLSPSSASLTGGQSTTFRPAVSGTSNTGVIWSLSPQVGPITNGVYQAPAVISSQQTITITATSAADPTKSASVSVILQPSAPPVTVSISLSPSSASLTGGQSTTFRPAVSGTSNTGVIWSLSPQVGPITNGVYQAPAVISSQQTITITATSAADPTKSASVSVILQ